MALFPGDMNIGWGFGRYTQEEDMSLWYAPLAPPLPIEEEQNEPHLTDPLLAVSELEQRVEMLEGHLLLEQAINQQALERVQKGELRITDLEERLRSLCIVVNSLVATLEEKG